MDKEKQEAILNKHPKLFPEMPFGIGTDNGWYNIIMDLCDCIQAYVDGNELPQPKVTQVKEKFGGLRFYADNTDELINGMIWFAEELSYHTCEVCGARGELRDDLSWMLTLCDKHYEKLEKH